MQRRCCFDTQKIGRRGKVHVDVQLHVQFDIFKGGMPKGVQFCQLVTVPKCEIPQPPTNQVFSTVHSQLPHYISLTFSDCSHTAPPFLESIRCDDPSREVVTTKEEFLSFWRSFILKDDFCLEVCCLILEYYTRITCIEVFDKSHESLVDFLILELVFHKHIISTI